MDEDFRVAGLKGPAAHSRIEGLAGEAGEVLE